MTDKTSKPARPRPPQRYTGSSTPEKTARRKLLFLDARKRVLNTTAACELTKIPRVTVQHWKNTDPKFAEAYKAAEITAIDRLEDEARKRAIEGWQEPVLYQGQLQFRHDPFTGELLLDENFEPIPLTINKKSDRLLEVMLGGKKPEYKKGGASVGIYPGGDNPIPKSITVNFVDSDGNGRVQKSPEESKEGNKSPEEPKEPKEGNKSPEEPKSSSDKKG